MYNVRKHTYAYVLHCIVLYILFYNLSNILISIEITFKMKIDLIMHAMQYVCVLRAFVTYQKGEVCTALHIDDMKNVILLNTHIIPSTILN